MNHTTWMVGLALLLACSTLRAQLPSQKEAPAIETESTDTEEDADIVIPPGGMPIVYTLTAGPVETAGRILSFAQPQAWSDLEGEEQDNTDNAKVVPSAYALEQNYPNPFNPSTTLRFDLPVQAQVTLRIYNILGQEVAVVVNGEQLEAGSHEVRFDASRLASGVYTYRIEASGATGAFGEFTRGKKMLLVK